MLLDWRVVFVRIELDGPMLDYRWIAVEVDVAVAGEVEVHVDVHVQTLCSLLLIDENDECDDNSGAVQMFMFFR